jgi:hypothetical protein
MKGIMLKKLVTAGLLSASFLVALPGGTAAAADVSVSVDIGVFHDRLSPYGDWISVNRYGSCWRPRHVARGWRPYTVGYWTYTDFGWTWVSEEDWGWATYHYGRWLYDPYYGWVWVPGRTWAPAYVAWRYGDGWIGWAPLPPGLEPRSFVNVDIGTPAAYSFVETRFFLDRQIGAHVVPESRNAALIRTTRNITRYDVRGSRVVNRGVDVREIERASGRHVRQLRVRDAGNVTGAPRAKVTNDALLVYRPSLSRPSVNRGREALRSTVQPPRAVRQRTRVEQRHAQPPVERRASMGQTVPERPVRIAPQRTTTPTAGGRVVREQPRRAPRPQVLQQHPRPESKARPEKATTGQQPPKGALNARPERGTTGVLPGRGAPAHAKAVEKGRTDRGGKPQKDEKKQK